LINSGGPCLPAKKAFTFKIIPGNKGAAKRAIRSDTKDSILIPLNVRPRFHVVI
jgi:hypothetical protein